MFRKVDRAITVLSRLNGLNRHWNHAYELFAASGSLCLVRSRDGKVMATFSHIVCDGGDPKFERRDDGEYLVRS